MTPPVVRNFRGAHALVCHADDGGRATLAATLQQLGLEVTLCDPADGAKPPITNFDVVFFDADDGIDGAAEPLDIPLIALIGVEAPSRLARVVKRRAAAYIIKPVRSSGIYTALVVAFSEHARRKAEADERAALSRRLAGRRPIVKAILHLMRRDGLDDDAAFQSLRTDAMRRRVPVEDVARELIEQADDDDQTAPETRNAKRM
ncbi:ANTAR domain-containing protein [Acuticoccus sp. M5D2P5]|uniref:ANTAR domain-containing response regulator n=1 Tax=Acuticoccus kalidii TaxID=2910977 RepID=UPI001F32912D|nr:ANTAR domain-containing protein [Acuticoccus kalidii]MCF3935477.1 ANTAR domain-containing protein [Acuticoccus kalidii]